jgi:exopolyphosphatase/guanosine-5'-triphosphate,3'-diphosphate pyrophosphatase
MKIAIIDCGTNTFNLLVKDISSNEITHNSKISVRLGEGRNEELLLADEAIDRALDALAKHKATALENGVKDIVAVATAAVRTAKNTSVLIEKAATQLGININVIDGDKEAGLIYKGVAEGVQFKDATTLIMDIGGGSTEFILLRDKKPVWQKSYPIVTSFMLNKFRPGDPILNEELEDIDTFLQETLAELTEVCQNDNPRVLIGSSGSFDTLAAMCAENFETSRFDKDESSYTFSMHEYMQISKRMLEGTFEERLNTPGMIPMRADMIVMACIEINHIIKRFGIRLIQQCNYALKEGLFLELQKNEGTWQKSSL